MSDINVQTFSGKVNVASDLKVGSSHLMVDTQNNQVGLNISNPEANLHVNGNVYINKDLGVGSQILLNERVATFGGTKTFVVTVASVGGADRFHIDGVDRPALTFHEYQTYIFDQSHASNNGHPIAFAEAVGGVTPYTIGVTSVGTPGQTGAKTTFKVSAGAPSPLYYYCTNHPSTMGSTSSNASVVSSGGAVYADQFVGDGSLLTNLPSGMGGVWSTNAEGEIYFTTSNVGISNADPAHELSVGSNLYVDDDGSNVLVVTGNVKANYFVGDGSRLTNLPSGTGGVWSTNAEGEIYFTTSNVGISNADPGHELSVGSNLYVDDDGSNVLVVNGNVSIGSTLTLDNFTITTSYGLNDVLETSNTSSNVMQLTNATTGLVATGNVHALKFIGDGSELTGITTGGLQEVTDNGNVTSNTVQFTNTIGFSCSGTGVVKLPSGTTAQQPSTGLVAGMVRFNSDLNRLEFWDGTSWNTVSGYNSVEATGGTTTDVVDSGVKYRVHTFSTVGTSNFVVTNGGEVEYLIVAGGGGGGGRYHSGGGGGGGVLQHKGFSVTPQTYSIVVGDGGAAGLALPTISQPGTNGGNSSAFGQTALGGGGGGSNGGSGVEVGKSGGSGGGAGGNSADGTYSGGNGTSGQGFRGGNGCGVTSGSNERVGGGGGGAGSHGFDATRGTEYGPGHGGDGVPSSISGTLEYYGGGGGGAGMASYSITNMGLGGKGGGGRGSRSGSPLETAGEDGKGGGGGGSDSSINGVGNGGSGVVIIRYRI